MHMIFLQSKPSANTPLALAFLRVAAKRAANQFIFIIYTGCNAVYGADKCTLATANHS